MACIKSDSVTFPRNSLKALESRANHRNIVIKKLIIIITGIHNNENRLFSLIHACHLPTMPRVAIRRCAKPELEYPEGAYFCYMTWQAVPCIHYSHSFFLVH